MSEIKLIDEFPLLKDGVAYPFRYDRWENLFLLEILIDSNKRLFLACYGCHFLKFEQAVPLTELKLLKEAGILVLTEEQRRFFLKFRGMELWSEDKFHSYDFALFNRFSEKERYGVRKPVTSADDL